MKPEIGTFILLHAEKSLVPVFNAVSVNKQ
jgi:hypothetical protein